MKTWQNEYKNSGECKWTYLDYDALLRGDNVIIRTRQDLYDNCSKCEEQEKCVENLKRIKEVKLKFKDKFDQNCF